MPKEIAESKGQECLLYQPHLQGRALFQAAAQVGQIQGESAYAQCMYCQDIQEQNLHFEFGYAALVDFTRTLWDWSARKTKEMLEIASLLPEFPKICNAFRKGRLSWTKARLLLRSLSEITDARERKEGEQKWLKQIGKTYQELQAALSQAFPENSSAEQKLRLQMDLPAQVFALWEKAYEQVKKELYEGKQSPEPSDVIETLARKVLAAQGSQTKVVAPAEISVSQCSDCKEKFLQTKTYGQIRLNKSICASYDRSRHIPVATYEKVLDKHHHQCAVPGCRHTLWLHAHHMDHFAVGGSHEEANLIILCSRHHRLLHEEIISLQIDKGEAIFRDSFGEVIGARRIHFVTMQKRIQEDCRYKPEIIARLLGVHEAIEDFCESPGL